MISAGVIIFCYYDGNTAGKIIALLLSCDDSEVIILPHSTA